MRKNAALILFLISMCSCASAQTKHKTECVSTDMMGSDEGIYVCSGEGKWVKDEKASQEALDRQRKYESHRKDLIWALRTRVLTAEEMQEVASWGTHLLHHDGMYVSNPVEDEKILNELLLQQFRIKAASKACMHEPRP